MSLPYFNRVCYATLGHEGPWTMETYRQLGGYEAWKKVLPEKTPRDAIIEEVTSSGLRRRGGAGFPTELKWSFIPKVPSGPH